MSVPLVPRASRRALILVLALAGCGGGGDSGGGGTAPVPPPPAVTSLQPVSGDGASARPGDTVLVAVRVLDGASRPLAGVSVQWTIASGGGTLLAASSASDSLGIARTRWVASGTGAVRIGAAAGSAPAATFALTVQTANQPSARFSIGDDRRAGAPTVFDGTGSRDGSGGSALTYTWRFGDGRRGGTSRIAHIFADGGTFQVTLIVRDTAGFVDSLTQSVVIAAPPRPANTVGAMRVLVQDIAGAAFPGVQVSAQPASPSTATTDAAGIAVLRNLPTEVPITLAFSAAGHAVQERVVVIPSSGVSEGYTEVRLMRRAAAVELANAERGGSVVGQAGARIDLPQEALIDRAGRPVTGTVQVQVTPLNVAQSPAAFPGSFDGVRADGTTGSLFSLGVMEIEISQGGRELDIAPGRRARIDIPIYTEGASAGDQIPLWSLDERTGVWTREGTGTVVAAPGTPSGLALRAEIAHLSWWNCDIDRNPAGGDPGFEVPDGETGWRAASVTITARARFQDRPNGPIMQAGPYVVSADSARRRFLQFPSETNIIMVCYWSPTPETIVRYDTIVRFAPNARTRFTIRLPRNLVPRPIGGVLEFGRPGSDLIPVNGAAVWTFAGSANDRVVVEGTRVAGNLTATLTAPNGEALFTAPLNLLRALILPASGTYTLTVRNPDAEPRVHTVQVTRAAVLPREASADGAFVSDVTQWWAFDVPTPGTYTIGLTTAFLGLRTFDVWSATGERLRSGSTAVPGLVSPAEYPAGTYLVRLRATSTEAYRLHLSSLAAPSLLTIASPFGEASGRIARPGAWQALRFTATAGERINLVLSTPNQLSARAAIRAPGTTVPFYERPVLQTAQLFTAVGYAPAETSPFTLTASGEYTVTLFSDFSPPPNLSGDWRVQLFRQNYTPLPFGTDIQSAITVPFEQPGFRVVVPTDTVVGIGAFHALGGLQTITLVNAATGQETNSLSVFSTHVLRLRAGTYLADFDMSRTESTGPFTLGFVPIAPPTALALDTDASGSFTRVAQRQYFRLQLAAGSRVQVRLSGVTASVTARLRRTSGADFYAGTDLGGTSALPATGSGESLPITIAEAGEYVLEVSQRSEVPRGNFTVRVRTVP